MDIQFLTDDDKAVLTCGLDHFIDTWSKQHNKDDWTNKWLGVAMMLKPQLDNCSRIVLETGVSHGNCRN